MHQGVSGGSPLDLPEPGQVAALEASLSVLELPELLLRALGPAEYVAHFCTTECQNPRLGRPWENEMMGGHTFMKAVHVELPYEGGDISVFKILPVKRGKSWSGKNPSAKKKQGTKREQGNIRKHLGKVVCRSHDEAVAAVGPRDELLDARVLQHAKARLSVK